jgi:hypothetical protein
LVSIARAAASGGLSSPMASSAFHLLTRRSRNQKGPERVSPG